MKEIEEILDCKISITLKQKESVLSSLVKDTFTFSFMLLCIYVSLGSHFWTFITGSMFLLFGFGKLLSILKQNTRVFGSKRAAIDYINAQDIEE